MTKRTWFTFDTTHHALWAEEVAGEHRIASELVPAPAEANARCNLALMTTDEEIEGLAAVLEAEGVPYRLYVR
jgi:selenocysteine lyase/cysteine desulfurase